MDKPKKCALCGSENDELDFHHLIPRSQHSKKWFEKRFDKSYMRTHGIWICDLFCHKQIHTLISEKDLGTTYNTMEKLVEHPEVKTYIQWRKKRIT